MRWIFVFFSLFCIYEAYACELQLPARVLITSVVNQGWPFEHRNCSKSDIQLMQQVLADQEGLIPLARLQAAVNPGITLSSSVEQVQIDNLQRLIRRSFSDASQASFTLKTPYQTSVVALRVDAELSLHCHPCQFAGEEIMRLIVRSEQDDEIHFQAQFERLVKALKLKTQLPAFSTELSGELFDEIQVPLTAYGQYWTDLSKIHLYKTNKTLRAGDLLRQHDLVTRTLVKAGDRVELIFENELVRLKSQALSRQNGGVGDEIEVWNQANGKKYRGTVVDENRVMVEL